VLSDPGMKLAGGEKKRQVFFSHVLVLSSAAFRLSWLEVLSGATVLAVTVTGFNYHVKVSAHTLESTNQENELTCNLILHPTKLKQQKLRNPFHSLHI